MIWHRIKTSNRGCWHSCYYIIIAVAIYPLHNFNTIILKHTTPTSILQNELSLREKMYQDLKERTDREIAQLNRTKQDLELRLRSVLESHQGGLADMMVGEGPGGSDLQSSEPLLSTMNAAGLPNLTASEVVEALSKWEGMEDTIVLFKEQLEKEHGEQCFIQRVGCPGISHPLKSSFPPSNFASSAI